MKKKETTKLIRIRLSSYNKMIKMMPKNDTVVSYASDAIDAKNKIKLNNTK